MADETKGPDAASNPSGNSQPPADEPRILEEVITHAAAKPQEKPAAPAAPAPVAVAQMPQKSAPELQSEASMQADIATILKGIQLPERRDFKASGDKRMIEQKPIDAALATPVAPAPATEAPKPEDKSPIVPVHTLKDDLQHVVRDQKISLVRAASLEEDRKYKKQTEETVASTPGAVQRSRRTAGILFSVLLLLALGGAALWGVYAVETARLGAATPKADQSSILFAEHSVPFTLANLSPAEAKQKLAIARTISGTLGSITRIAPVVTTTSGDGTSTTRPATFAEFMTALGAKPPDDLIRALSTDFFFGIHTVDKNAPIIIVPVVAYDRAFAGMLAWEPAMNSDLAPVFTAVPPTTVDPQGLPIKRTFVDLVMKNYDARVLKDDSGTIELYYSFPTQNLLVIAESPYSFTEVLSRLQAEGKL